MLRRCVCRFEQAPPPTHTPAARLATLIKAQPLTMRSQVSRLILVRHGESEADRDLAEYCRTPDWRIPLTDRGREQACAAGARVRQLVTDQEDVFVYASPFRRSQQTVQSLLTAASFPSERLVGGREDPRLRPCDKGQLVNLEALRASLAEREKFGRFFYRYAQGESGADVHDRVSSFLDTFHREKTRFVRPTAVVIVTHGLTMRIFAMKLFNLTVESFETMKSLPVGSVLHLRRLKDDGDGPGTLERFTVDADQLAKLRIPESLSDHPLYLGRNKDLLGSTSLGAPFI